MSYPGQSQVLRYRRKVHTWPWEQQREMSTGWLSTALLLTTLGSTCARPATTQVRRTKSPPSLQWKVSVAAAGGSTWGLNILTSFLWSIRIQTMGNVCRFVFCLFFFFYKNIYGFDFLFRVWERKKEIAPPSLHFHGWTLSTNQRARNRSVARGIIVNYYFSS